MTHVTRITGVGPAMAARLAQKGFSTAEDLAAATPAALQVVSGIGPTTAPRLIAAARALTAPVDVPAEPTRPAKADTTPAPAGKKTGRKKDKDKKKDKKPEKKKKDKKKAEKKAARKKAQRKKAKAAAAKKDAKATGKKARTKAAGKGKTSKKAKSR